ncbi:Prolamin-like domain containing protein [Parasponia andersonii]|uniref:Prolamin-like domain containing protein n=1 Tax=Parasponia andersonii TaxID=3476 RepID=A0A2P5CI82_PARAD|nr:Prolamin-like domain containing protein [Parasponia andersonii]
MKSCVTLFVVVALLGLTLNDDNNNNVAATRDFPAGIAVVSVSSDNITERLETSGGLVECWTALLELKSCLNEIVLFFLNGQTDIGNDCCRAVVFIARNCWPAMLTSLGFTVQEGDILQGYCDAVAVAPPPALVPIIAPSPAPFAHPPVALAKPY